MHLVMTGDRSLLAGRISALCEEKLAFKLAEREDYALTGLRPRDMPDDIPPGRAFRAVSGIETQVALLAPTPPGRDRQPRCEPSRHSAGPATRRSRLPSGRSG